VPPRPNWRGGQEIVEETIGTDSAAGRAIAERVGQQLRGPEPERTPRSGDDHDGDDDNDPNIWR
jgi:hypothetical protein